MYGSFAMVILTILACQSAEIYDEQVEQSVSEESSVLYDRDTTSVYMLDEWPQVPSVWNGHLIGYVIESMNVTPDTMVLVSVCDIMKVQASEAKEKSRQYVEPNTSVKDAAQKVTALYDWYIPSIEEVERWKIYYSFYEERYNELLMKMDGSDPLLARDEKDKNIRYLCEDAQYTFCLGPSTSIIQAGKTVKYRLRLFRKVPFRINEIKYEF